VRARVAFAHTAAVVGLIAVAVACGGGDEREPSGKSVARQYACLSCHGPDGQGGTGPTWVGLFGSEVTLTDGTTVTVDEEYLRLAVRQPAAQVREGMVVPMPVNSAVTDDDLELIIDYIKSLAPDA